MKRRVVTNRRVKVRMAGDRRTAELVQLEVRRLARAMGLPVASVQVRRIESSSR